MASGSRWIDVSVTLESGMVCWPGDPAVRIERVCDVDEGAAAAFSHIDMGAHTGTHIDAPRHFARDGMTIDDMPLAAVMGAARVIHIRAPDAIRPAALRGHAIRRVERILFRTRNSSRCWGVRSFVHDFVHVSTEAAGYLVSRGVRTVGVDYLSVGSDSEEGNETHRILLEAGVWVIEGLNLSAIKAGRYDLVCLPLKILDGDGAPARAVLRPRKKGR